MSGSYWQKATLLCKAVIFYRPKHRFYLLTQNSFFRKLQTWPPPVELENTNPELICILVIMKQEGWYHSVIMCGGHVTAPKKMITIVIIWISLYLKQLPREHLSTICALYILNRVQLAEMRYTPDEWGEFPVSPKGNSCIYLTFIWGGKPTVVYPQTLADKIDPLSIRY